MGFYYLPGYLFLSNVFTFAFTPLLMFSSTARYVSPEFLATFLRQAGKTPAVLKKGKEIYNLVKESYNTL